MKKQKVKEINSYNNVNVQTLGAVHTHTHTHFMFTK